jgi:bacterial/archaeal transporter family protein
MRQWLFPTFGAFILWGLWSFIPKITTRYITPKSAILFEVLGGIVVAAAVLISMRFKPDIHPVGIALALTTGILGFSGALLFLYAVSKGPVSLVAVLSALYPVITVLLSIMILKEAISMKQWLGIALGLVSMLLIAG